jgi:hypothetical protein
MEALSHLAQRAWGERRDSNPPHEDHNFICLTTTLRPQCARRDSNPHEAFASPGSHPGVYPIPPLASVVSLSLTRGKNPMSASCRIRTCSDCFEGNRSLLRTRQDGDPGEIRTHNILGLSQTPLPVGLRGRDLWSPISESNRWPLSYQESALATELSGRDLWCPRQESNPLKPG